jgi:neutral ceramidase
MKNFIGIHDPLNVRALILDNGSAKIALLSVDTGGLANASDLVQATAAELGIPVSHLSISATHDHSTPNSPGGGRAAYDLGPYNALLKKGVLEAARQANSHLQPARIGFGTGKAYVNTNRDEKIGDGYHMGYSPEGPSDKTVAVIKVTTPSGEPIAIWSNYAVHAVVMFLSKTKDGHPEVSGDIGGATAAYVEDRMKGAIALWTPGAAGDQNPLFMSTYNQDAPDVHDEGAAGWAILDVLSRRLGEEVVRVARGTQNTTDRVVLWGDTSTVTCPGRVRDPRSAAVPAAAVTNTSGSPTATSGGPVRIVDGGDPVKIPLQLLMINDIALANVGGEVFNEISQKFKKESLFDRTAMVTLNNGSIGYIPSEKSYLLPSQMAVNNRIKPGCAEDSIVNGFLSLEKQYVALWNVSH